MKQGINPTRKQKELMVEQGLNPSAWLVSKSLQDRLELVHRMTGVRQDVYLKEGAIDERTNSGERFSGLE